ncbi:MAG: SDR family NAD(P)-dependent oxidoreductase [Actinomycetia bacterium]|nr:SDR family NAD(P)-dependent oxidoreductase [Actinomycetes bacterium]
MDIAGKTALVTGGGTGLGREISLQLARAGADVAVNYSRSKDEAAEVAAEIDRVGQASVAVQADVSDRNAVGAMVSAVEDALGPIDILVNNAGVTRFIPFDDIEAITNADWDYALRVNVIGAFNCVQAIAPAMGRRGGGAIINVSSISPFVATGSSLPYTVSKAGLLSMTTCLCRALPKSIRINALAPGWMATPWLDRYVPDEIVAKIREGELPTVPVEQVAAMALELIRNDGASGQTVVLDAGDIWRK